MVSTPKPARQSIVLASASAARATLLTNAGIEVETEVTRIDEPAIKAAMLAEGASARDIADRLSEMKARRAAQRHPEKLVLGCDQVLVQEDNLYNKPADLEDARAQLRALRGKSHELLSAAVIFENGSPVWRHIGRAQLAMRGFSDDFLDNYLDRISSSVLDSVGCYHLEGLGAQLFTRVEGDYFSVLGLPLLEVLGFLRTRGFCPE